MENDDVGTQAPGGQSKHTKIALQLFGCGCGLLCIQIALGLVLAPKPTLLRVDRLSSALRRWTHGATRTSQAATFLAKPPTNSSANRVWPLVQQTSALPGAVALQPAEFQFVFLPGPTPAILQAAFGRYSAILFNQSALPRHRPDQPGIGDGASQLTQLVVSVDTLNETLDLHTDEAYNLTVEAVPTPSATLHAKTVYGVLRGLETFAQLAVPIQTPPSSPALASTNSIGMNAVKICDYPEYRWRGFMVDTGRRFWPVSLLHWLLDSMVANKMNVLHLHFSDFCRFAVESKVYPELTANLTGEQAGHYTQEDIAGLVLYAQQRGIRVVPEVDLPGHARGMMPLEADGLEFCTVTPHRSQLYGDQGNRTFGVLGNLLTEMAGLFPDPVVHMGSDETHSKGPCSLANTKQLERKVLDLLHRLGKQPMAWVNALTTTHAATPETILGTWATVYGMPNLVTSAGYQCVASTYMYLNHISGDIGSYEMYWRDIAPGVTPDAKAIGLMLGGEVSMWTDDYCHNFECGSAAGPTPVGAALYGPNADREFAASIAGVVFPRASVGAGSLWNFQLGLPSNSSGFRDRMRLQNDRLVARGLDTCPTGCNCDVLTRCGHPYMSNTSWYSIGIA